MGKKKGSIHWELFRFVFTVCASTLLTVVTALFLMYVFGALDLFERFPIYVPYLLVVCACAIVMLLLAIPFGRAYLRPVLRLSQGMQAVAKGDFGKELDTTNVKGEMQQLLTNFNRMTLELAGTELFRRDFINHFSHEFKTPIVSVRGFAHQLLKGNLSPEQQREYLEIIEGEADRLARMSANVLLLSHLENQNIFSEKEEFDLDEQLRHCILILERHWARKGLFFAPELERVRYVANMEMLSHVWINLLSNAIKFSPQGAEIEVTCHREEDNVVVSVSNAGEGIPEDKIVHIFDQFYQGDPSHKAEGNGLGLSIAKKIVSVYGGSISVRSELGEKTTFTVILPQTVTELD